MKRTSHRGFTVVELLITVVIIGVLAAVALPAYQEYARRGKLSEVVLAASGCRTTVTEVFLTAEVLPTELTGGWGCESSVAASQYVASIRIGDAGTISVTVATGIDPERADHKVLTLVPFVDASTPMAITDRGKRVFMWVCGSASSTPPTTVARSLLPGSCRG